jgi:uncharacterized protein (DUF1778 family)
MDMMVDDERRTRPVSFTVTPAQSEAIERAAAAEALSVASFVRRVVVMNLAKQQPAVTA